MNNVVGTVEDEIHNAFVTAMDNIINLRHIENMESKIFLLK